MLCSTEVSFARNDPFSLLRSHLVQVLQCDDDMDRELEKEDVLEMGSRKLHW